MANIRIANLHQAVLKSSEITEINAELAAAVNGGFIIGKNWKHPIEITIVIH